MARSGDIIEAPGMGQKMRFEATGHDNGGEVMICDYFVQPAPFSVSPPLSTHRFQSELFRVVSGRFGVHVGGVDHLLNPGEEVIVPPGTPHMAWNDGPEVAHLILEFRPARNIDGFFETEFGLANNGKLAYVLRNGRRTVRPSPLQGAALCRDTASAYVTFRFGIGRSKSSSSCWPSSEDCSGSEGRMRSTALRPAESTEQVNLSGR